MAVRAEIDIGRVVAGKYELVRLIGRGAMGEVWLATHNSLGGEFAIKLVKPDDDTEDADAASRFQQEAQISAKLSRRTRHIVSVSDHGEENGLAYLVMELLEGESLEARIDRTADPSLAETVAIVMQVARALEQAHAEGVFHRDLKPANVFLTKDEDGRLLVKLLDFGIARATKAFRTRSPVTTGKDMVLGTPSYMSPEQARGLDTLDHRCDLWALAVVAYQSLAREIPWEGKSVEDIFLSICTHRMIPILQVRPDLPPAVEAIFTRSFAGKLDDRFHTAAELSEAFEALVDPLAVEAAMGGAPRAAPSSPRRLPAGSDHDLASAMALGQPGRPRTDPNGIEVDGPTSFHRRSKRSSGWLLAAVAALVTIGVIIFGLRSFTSRNAASATTLPSSPPPSTVPAGILPPPTVPVAPATAALPTATSAIIPSSKVRPRPALASKETASPHAPPPASPAAPVVTAPPVVTAAPPPSPPTPTGPRGAPDAPDARDARDARDKSGVF